MQAEVLLDYDVVPAGHALHRYALLRIRADAPREERPRQPLNLSVVLDRSGSMRGDKLAYVKQATQFLVQRLAGDDRFSLVTYDSRVTVELPPGAVVYKDSIQQVIDAIEPGTATNLSGGWLAGCKLVASSRANGQVRRVLLLTDGLANEGITDPARLAALARQIRDEGITTTTMGVGMDFNEDLLRQMASEGGGAFYFIDDPDQAPHIFREELNDLLNVIGQNLVVTLQPSPGVHRVAQFNVYPTDTRGQATAFRMGDLFAGEIKLLLLELSLPALRGSGTVEIARLKLDHEQLHGETVTHQTTELPVVVHIISDEEYAARRSNADVVRSLLVLGAARAREIAIRYADEGNFDEASQALTQAADAIEESEFSQELNLLSQHDMLREEAVDMGLGAARYDEYTRKVEASKAAYYGESRTMRVAEADSLHRRMKAARTALERHGATPARIGWRGESMILTKNSLRLGRAYDNDIIIPDDDVSKYHCQVVRSGDSLYLEDLGSTNGTYANGGRVVGRFRLSVGDVMTVGSWFFTFRA